MNPTNRDILSVLKATILNNRSLFELPYHSYYTLLKDSVLVDGSIIITKSSLIDFIENGDDLILREPNGLDKKGMIDFVEYKVKVCIQQHGNISLIEDEYVYTSILLRAYERISCNSETIRDAIDRITSNEARELYKDFDKKFEDNRICRVLYTKPFFIIDCSFRIHERELSKLLQPRCEYETIVVNHNFSFSYLSSYTTYHTNRLKEGKNIRIGCSYSTTERFIKQLIDEVNSGDSSIRIIEERKPFIGIFM